MEVSKLRHKITITPHPEDLTALGLDATYQRFAEVRGQTALERQTADANHGQDLRQMKCRYDEITKHLRNGWEVEDDGVRFKVLDARDPDGRYREMVAVLGRIG